MSVAFAAVPASAGGPTSVLLVEPGTRAATSLYYTDAEYEALAGQVGAASGSGIVGEVDRSGGAHEFGSGITMTWLIHDVAVWRVDRVFLAAKGGPWISTQLVMNDSGNIYDSPVTWHTAKDPGKLTALLADMGFGPGAKASTGGGTSGDIGAGDAVPAAPAAAAEKPPTSRQPADTSTPVTGGILWGLAGLALGVALTVAAVRVLPRTTEGQDENATAVPPGTDDLPAPATADERETWTVPDVLSRSGG
jgi:hypothetical protein